MGISIVFVVSADAAVSDSVKALVESAGLPAETFRSLQMFLDAAEPDRRGCLVLDAIINVLQVDTAAQSGLQLRK